MARYRKTGTKRPIESYEHRDKERKQISIWGDRIDQGTSINKLGLLMGEIHRSIANITIPIGKKASS